MSESQVFWLISAPNRPGADIFDIVNTKTAKENSLSENVKFNIPALRVGTLNSLIALNDDLAKVDNFVELTSKKISKQLTDLVGSKPGKEKGLSINGQNIQQYLSKFQWDDAKFNPKSSLQEIVDKIQSTVAKLDEDLRAKLTDYNSLTSSVVAEERKLLGNLQVRSLNELITTENNTQSEYLTTAFIVIPQSMEKEFLATYENLSDELSKFVLMRSAKKIEQDNDYVLYGVCVFRKFYDNFRIKCQERKWVVRDFKTETENKPQERSKLSEDQKNYKTSFIRWCRIQFPESFVAWIHLKALRVFVESVLRFGIPMNFQAILMKPHKKEDRKLRDVLLDQFKYLGSQHISGKGEEDASEKFFPYVYVPIDWDI
ncbi:H(+)-transporting ATPase [Cavenderia fasciculata]|uniref:V-type proton ATPase subunit C n=1 Tax=Cavenderia fasciculata TaxID=261658 RepID=F4Q2Y6_CACFS|nr:H(+)-transporting ATPase [Cavenderia fasciculata]EGG17550.1 H(+)-transporting ATPase [Cavenderia fasciculata]|eukprot:XP_004356034.1 H(+)-transporting ATPase [Cavenderia fasciculata]